MQRQTPRPAEYHLDGLTLAAATWLASGIVLLGLTPLPLHDVDWGWSPAFWLLAAPAILLYARHLCTQRLQVGDLPSSQHGRQLARRRSTGGYTHATSRERGKYRPHTGRMLRRAG